VTPEERGQGSGVRFISQLSRTLLTGTQSLCVLVNEENEAAQACYEKAGYKVRGKLRHGLPTTINTWEVRTGLHSWNEEPPITLMTKQRLFKPFLYTLVAAGVAVVLFSIRRLPIADLDWRFLVLAITTATVASRLTIRIPRVKGEVTVGDTLIFLAILLYDGEAAILLAAADALGSSLRVQQEAARRPIQRRPDDVLNIFDCLGDASLFWVNFRTTPLRLLWQIPRRGLRYGAGPIRG